MGRRSSFKVGMRKPSISKSLSARTSAERIIRNELGLKAPKGGGWITDPEKAAYNRVYSRTTFSFWGLLKKLFR